MPLYEFRCDACGIFDLWRSLAQSSDPVHCPECKELAKKVFSPPAILSGTLRLKQENPEPQLVKRDREPTPPRAKSCNNGRPWMISH